MTRRELGVVLEEAYGRLNVPELIHPDPLEFVFRYEETADREVAGLVAACLAYGRVPQILASVARVLDPMGVSPAAFLSECTERGLRRRFAGFKHRWTTSEELVAFLLGVQRARADFGSLEGCFTAFHDRASETTVDGLAGFVGFLGGDFGKNSLLASPKGGSACKRLHLYLRWMVRRDAVDPGCWPSVSPAVLVVPLDTHMHRAGRALRLIRRKSPDLAAALEMTRAFKSMRPEDPLRYDFTLTRMGIRDDLDLQAFIQACRTGHPSPVRAAIKGDAA